jgi:hypothetical protein
MLRLQPPLPERYADATQDDLADAIASAKASLGERLLILGHHYQRDEVMRWADLRGDSFGLSRMAADRAADGRLERIVFCGVHFMAESADILTPDHVTVTLPDLNAGCSMADMADEDSVEEAWEAIGQITDLVAGVPDPHRRERVAQLHAGVPAQVLVGEEEHLVAALERPGEDGPGVRRGADGPAVAADERLQRRRAVHVGDGNQSLDVDHALE